MNRIFLDETFRTPGKDHLTNYRNSCFYNLLNKSVKERGTAYEEIANKIFKSEGKECELSPNQYGKFDLILDGVRKELKASRRASPYDTRNRTFQFNSIKDNGVDILLMVIETDDTVSIYSTTFNRVKDNLIVSHRDKNKNPVMWALEKCPTTIDTDFVVKVQMA